MRQTIMVFLLLTISCTIATSQQKHQFDIYAGAGINIIGNQRYDYNKDHYQFKSPVTAKIALNYHYRAWTNTSVILRIDQTAKAIKLAYDLNESAIPYNYTHNVTEKYAVTSLNIGLRHYCKKVWKGHFFYDAGLSLNYAVNSTIKYSGSGSANSTGLMDTIFYENGYKDHLDSKRIFAGAYAGIGIEVGKRYRSSFMLQTDIPFARISNESSLDHNFWRYKGVSYNHNMAFSSSVYYIYVMYGYAIFKR